ncbi:MAG: Glyoxalase/bleomycin resistance protein/dioxygenase [Bradyrhizobium sp.]|nr:Glyoxalase/bleomycin resistance protein/dioxygenase [Bradyrhizobium sp.]
MSQRLAYCGLGVADVDAWMRFATDGLGLVPDNRGGLQRLRMDQAAWRFAVHESPANDLLYAGFELDGVEELAACRDRITNAGVDCTSLSDAELDQRQVVQGFCLHDPDGLRLEFVTGHAVAATPFESPLAAGFNTGAQGLGHVVLAIGDLGRGIAFYEALGFAMSDFITVPMGPDAKLRIAFMHCNPRHHSLAIAALPGGKRLNHVMVELTEVDDVLLGYQRCVAQGYKVGGIGRHPNDRMLSFYVQTPAGFDVEYGWGGVAIEGAWSVAEYDQISIWGHERVA